MPVAKSFRLAIIASAVAASLLWLAGPVRALEARGDEARESGGAGGADAGAGAGAAESADSGPPRSDSPSRADTNTQGSDAPRSGYSYLRLVSGDATVNSRWNGRVDARRNMPISTGDEISVSEAGRVEVGLADGNTLHVGGGTRAEFESLSAQQGEDDEFSAIRLEEGSVVLAAIGRNDDRIPRIDTDDATVYLSPGARARVNFDPRRGTVVIDRSGTVEVRTRTGSSRLRAGQYLSVRGDEEPDVARGAFSRDRFDIWAADRMDSMSDGRNASARYVDSDSAADVESLDGYGDWSYSPTYQTEVWTPHVDIGWTPYGFGSWYYTPAGLTWWSNDPWGWYPFHYGNWFFEASLSRWCWAPASVYSPAWVYWAYSPGFVGWCPAGWYSGVGSWSGYYGRGGFNRANLYVSLHGTFDPRRVDFRGWNFTGSGGVGGTLGRAEIIPGSRMTGRLGNSVAISSRPIVVGARPGEGREAVRDYIREAPRVIERTATGDSTRFAPILARDRNLPPASAEALRDRAVIADRGRLSGAAAADIAPRGTRLVERERVGPAETSGSGVTREAPALRTEAREAPGSRTEDRSAAPRTAEDWRGRPRVPGSATGTGAGGGAAGSPAAGAASSSASSSSLSPAVAPEARLERARSEREAAPADWRVRRIARDNRDTAATANAAAADSAAPRSVRGRDRDPEWRSREVPPARRVIEGAVPGRLRDSDGVRARPVTPDTALRPESSFRSEPRMRPEPAPAPRVESRPAAAPPRAESRPAPAPRVESRPAPAPHSDRNRKD